MSHIKRSPEEIEMIFALARDILHIQREERKSALRKFREIIKYRVASNNRKKINDPSEAQPEPIDVDEYLLNVLKRGEIDLNRKNLMLIMDPEDDWDEFIVLRLHDGKLVKIPYRDDEF